MSQTGNGASLVRVAAAAAAVGAVLALVGNAIHPRSSGAGLPTGSEYLELVSGNGAWTVVHALIVIASLLFLAGQWALTEFLAGTPGARLAALALSFAVLGGAVNMVDLLVDGGAMPALARLEDEQGSDAALVDAAATAVNAVDFALFTGIMLAFFGVPFLLYGLAVALSGRLPVWLGWLGAALAALMICIGTWQLVGGVSSGTYKVAFPPLAAGLSLWLGAIGMLVFRHARGARTSIASR